MIMYHCTALPFLEEILKTGLKPKKPFSFVHRNKKIDPIEGVYLSKHPFIWMYNSTLFSTHGGVLIELDINGIELFPDHIADIETKMKNENFFVKEPIPTSRFIKIWTSTAEAPNSFKELKWKRIK